MSAYIERRVAEISKVVRKAVAVYADNLGYPKNLGGMCAIASFTISKVLEDEGIDAKPVQGFYGGWAGHCWVEVRGRVVDITATQFKEFSEQEFVSFPLDKKVAFGYHAHQDLNWRWSDRLNHWPPEQQPTGKVLDSVIEIYRRFA